MDHLDGPPIALYRDYPCRDFRTLPRDVQRETMGGKFPEIPASREMGGKSLSLGNSQVTGISRAMGNSSILEAITFFPGIQITI